MRSKAVLFMATALLAVGLARPASADLVVYAATAEGDFGSLDLTTGQYTSIGPSNVQSIVGMGFVGNTLYGVDNNTSGAGFYSIDTSTGAATLITTLLGTGGAPLTAIGGTTGFGGFYGVTQDPSASVFGADTSGAFRGSLPLGFQGDGLVAFDAGFNYMYASAYTGNPFTGDELYAVNTSTLAVTDVGPLNDGVSNGQQAITGLLFGSSLYVIDGTNIFTYTVSPSSVSPLLTTTAITGLNPNGDFVTAVAGSVPEPSSVVMVSIGIVAAGIFRSRRRFPRA